MQYILGSRVERSGLGIPESSISAARGNGTSVVILRELVASLIYGMNLNYMGHWAYVRKSSVG